MDEVVEHSFFPDCQRGIFGKETLQTMRAKCTEGYSEKTHDGGNADGGGIVHTA